MVKAPDLVLISCRMDGLSQRYFIEVVDVYIMLKSGFISIIQKLSNKMRVF